MRRLGTLLVASFVLAGPVLSGCSGPLFGAPDEPSSHGHRRSGPSTTELLAIDIGSLPTTADGVHSLTVLSEATQSAREAERATLRAHRGQLVADLLVASRAYRGIQPMLSEWYAAAAGVLVDVDAADPGFAQAAVRRVRIDLTDAGHSDVEAVLDEVRAALGIGDPPRGSSPRAQVLRLIDLSDGLGPWSRYGDACDGGRFARSVVAMEPVSVPADELGPSELATDTNIHTAQALMGVVQACANVRRRDTGLTRAVAPLIEDIEARVAAAAVPLDMPSEFVTGDARLVPPMSFLSAPPEAGRGLGFTFRRVVLVRTDGVYVMVVPHLSLSEARELECPAIAAGWGFPGRQLVTFERIGSLPPSALVDDRVPVLGDGLAEMEGWLSAAAFLPPEETRLEDNEVGASLIADGDTYFSTLRPVLSELRALRYGPIALHTLHAESGALDAVAVRLVGAPAEDDNLLIVREDGYLIQAYDPQSLRPPDAISRVQPNPNLALHQHLLRAVADGTLDPGKPLTIRVDDNSVDYGILAHLVASVGFVRELDGVADDRSLLAASIATTEQGVPRILWPAGLRLAL